MYTEVKDLNSIMALTGDTIMERADRLYKSDDRMLFGVASGTAEYLGIDPTLARLAWVAAAFVTGGIGVIVYLVMAIVMPARESVVSQSSSSVQDSETPAEYNPGADSEYRKERARRRRVWRYVVGIGLIGFGVAFLLNNLGVWNVIRWDLFWPVAVIAVGLAILVPSIRR